METPRKFITAVINLRGVSTKQNYNMFYRHANVQRTYTWNCQRIRLPPDILFCGLVHGYGERTVSRMVMPCCQTTTAKTHRR